MENRRLINLQKTLKPQEALLIENPIDLFYLTGLSFSRGKLLLTHEIPTLFLDPRYLKFTQSKLSFDVIEEDRLPQTLSNVKRIYIDSGYLTVDAFEKYQNEFPKVTWDKRVQPLAKIREIKEKAEVASLKKAAELTYLGYRHLLSLLKEGVSERELGFAFEVFCREKGADKLSFDPIIAFGENSAYPHYRAGHAKLKSNQIVQFDLGVAVEGYAGDMSRVFFFGKVDPKLEQFYHWTRRAHKKALSHLCPGMAIGELDLLVKQEFAKEGVEDLFVHALGHGVGLEVHESPRIKSSSVDAKRKLQEGMVITIEPGLYMPGLGGVRYEDTLLITQEGFENFYPSEE